MYRPGNGGQPGRGMKSQGDLWRGLAGQQGKDCPAWPPQKSSNTATWPSRLTFA
ncbi:MAG: hypothetical protein JWO67_924 [Streptosporangiaceae bacterium]|nr:hypothetical protein [Streptosporangiaceae bacterium]